ncbi:Low molecular weight phosphotyrosine protein phosphatase [Arthrobacter crystallopoietes BAB-32]|uniref:Low molecular weight phosphotyrosine protein phosphatase n=1 Tax=Arthrobacter crystallopoietes BAB-32 TaxID=1246476 RepID=N1UWY7_9MICC|nr:low molecular weight phosphatase family protein [Arthrobacter crystallopoietes]EMY33585.1 Low molecular weight phosphotyrosine protein phosphatase [Arthrobacter crystallopoietes BAB-32]
MIRILTICTGNICRSPMAERLLQQKFDEIRPGLFEVRSAGIQALVDKPMDARAEGLLHVLGGSSDGFVARQLQETHLTNVDLVLAMGVEHRDRILSLMPRLLKRTFTVRELARMVDAVAEDPELEVPEGTSDDDVEYRWKRLPHLAALKRHQTRAADPLEDEIVDPYRRDDDVYRQMVRDLVPALERLVEFERVYHQMA